MLSSVSASAPLVFSSSDGDVEASEAGMLQLLSAAATATAASLASRRFVLMRGSFFCSCCCCRRSSFSSFCVCNVQEA